MQHLGIFGIKDKQRILYPVYRRILTIFDGSTGVVTNLQESTTFLKDFSSTPPLTTAALVHTPAPVQEVPHRTTLKPWSEKKTPISKGTRTTSTDKNQVLSGFADVMLSHSQTLNTFSTFIIEPQLFHSFPPVAFNGNARDTPSPSDSVYTARLLLCLNSSKGKKSNQKLL